MKLKRPLTLVVLGRSGSGKGTQVELLRSHLRPALVIELGKLLRHLSGGKSVIAREVRNIMLRGDLVPTWLVQYLTIHEIVHSLHGQENIIIDGTRQKKEAMLLDGVLKDLGRPWSYALDIYISPKEAVKRLLLRGRSDDTRSAIRRRLAYFKRDVMPTLGYYRSHHRLIRINGEQSIKNVFRDIKKAIT